MANGRGGRTNIDKGRDPGRFIVLPVSVLESAAYLSLSANARSLLLEVAYQFHGDDNGRMLLSRAYLKTRGWKSSDMISKGKCELLNAELIFQTVEGCRPNKASWYALTWRKLDKLKGFDPGMEKAFEQGAYRKSTPLPKIKEKVDWTLPNGGRQDAGLNPHCGAGEAAIGPPHGTDVLLPVPQCGPIRPVSPSSLVPPYGHPLEEPSVGAGGLMNANGLGTAISN